jgi:hypothetical protein
VEELLQPLPRDYEKLFPAPDNSPTSLKLFDRKRYAAANLPATASQILPAVNIKFG